MSGCTDLSECPNCGNDMTTYQDWKPINLTENWCLHCGWYSTTKFGQMGLDELNERRGEEEVYDEETEEYKILETLTELPKCITDPWEAIEKRKGYKI